MSIMISVGTLLLDDPSKPHAPLRVWWPGDTAAHPGLPSRPARAFNLRGWSAWRRSRSVWAFLHHCHVPADVDHASTTPIDAALLARIDAVYRAAQRWVWLPWADPVMLERAQWLRAWAQHARATFGGRAYLSIS